MTFFTFIPQNKIMGGSQENLLLKNNEFLVHPKKVINNMINQKVFSLL